MTTSTTLPDSIFLALPEEWLVLPTEGAELDRNLRELSRQLLDSREWSTTDRRRIELLIARIGADVRASGLSMAAVLVGNLAPDAPRSESISLTDEGVLAFCTVAYVSREALGSPLPLSPSVLMASFELPNDQPNSDMMRRRNLEPVVVIDLPSGEAVRRICLVEYGDATRSIELLEDVFYVPTRDGSGLCIVQFTSPTISLSRDLSELFAAIAATLQLLYPGDTTPLTRTES